MDCRDVDVEGQFIYRGACPIPNFKPENWLFLIVAFL